MLDQGQRQAILELHKEGNSVHAIADALGVFARRPWTMSSRAAPPRCPHLVRAELAGPHHEEILAQYAACKGNLVRVYEEIVVRGAKLSYQALTAYCRPPRHRQEAPSACGPLRLQARRGDAARHLAGPRNHRRS